jgi:hypothetical protein
MVVVAIADGRASVGLLRAALLRALEVLP